MEVPRLNYSDEFVKTLYTLSRKEITPELQAEARKCLLDGLGSLYGGMELMRKHVDAYLDQLPEVPGGASVIGHGRRASMQDAALTNALSLHVLDMDDGHRFSTVHLAASVLPAILAVGECRDLSMDDLIRALLVGYETGIRMGRCIQPANRARGFHSSGTAGTLGAAMAVAALLDFTQEEMKDALAAACTSAAGSLEVMENVSTLKPFNPARACHAGITAALIARSGLKSPMDPLDGKFGFLRAMGETSNREVLTLAFDPGWNIRGCYHKIHAACRHTHAPVDGVLAIRAQADFRPEDVESVLVEMYGQGIKGHNYSMISTPLEAKMSIPYAIACALVTGSCGMTAFSEKNIRDPEIQRILQSVRVVEDPSYTAIVPMRRPARVTLTLRDGRSYTEDVQYAMGEPENPMTEEAFLGKFRDLAKVGGKSREEAERVIDAALHFEGSVREFIRML